MGLHNGHLQVEFDAFWPPVKNMHFLAKNVFFAFSVVYQKLLNFFKFSQRQSIYLLISNIFTWFFHSNFFPIVSMHNLVHFLIFALEASFFIFFDPNFRFLSPNLILKRKALIIFFRFRLLCCIFWHFSTSRFLSNMVNKRRATNSNYSIVYGILIRRRVPHNNGITKRGGVQTSVI